MAIEKNKRKRKHKSAENGVDNGEVPKKVSKKAKSPKKLKNEEPTHVANEEQQLDEINKTVTESNENEHEPEPEPEEDLHEDANRDSGFEEREMKFSKDFKMLNFRTKLRGTNFITELRHFLYVVQTRPKMVAKYIEKRGKPLELAEALERIDKSNVLHIAYICQALQMVVMEIITNEKQHIESAVHACRYFLKSHGNVIEQLLKSTQWQHRRIALKLLTAIVCAEPQLGRQLLSSYEILSNVKTIENFLSHSKYEVYEEESVRKCYIHFVLAYLVDGNTLLIRNILDRVALLRALASGLNYDDHVTVCVVLSTLRKYVLECADISKTKKVHVFDLECCKNFARLYDWHGPKVFAAKFAGKNATNAAHLPTHEIDALVDANERDAVAAAAHDFLVVLLTSRKHGITFDAITHFRQKHNALQGKIIGALYKPWCNARKTELVLKILNACPDLARHTVRNFAGIVNPMRTPQRDWVQAVEFLAKIIDALQPTLLRNALEKITLTDFSYWIKDICLPIETLVLLTGAKMLRHANFDFRLATNRLLLAMFTQYSNYIAVITKREQSKGGANSLRRFKFDMLNHILVNFPTVEDILYSLYLSIETQAHEDVAVLQHLEVMLDLMLVICKENRAFINKTNTILDYLQLLRPLYADDEAQTAVDERNIKLELKAIKTILLLFPKALEPKEELFSSVLNSLIKAYIYGTCAVQRESGALLRGIFENTGLFVASELEIDLWLEALRFSDAATVDMVTQVFIEVLQVTKAEVELPKTAETIANAENLHKLFAHIEQGLSVQAYIEAPTLSKLMPLIFKGVEIVAPLARYLETVCLLMFHYYPKPAFVLQLYETKFENLLPYMRSWLPKAHVKQKHLATDEIATQVPHLIAVQMHILNGNTKFIEIIGKPPDNATFELELHGKLVQLDSRLQNERLPMLYAQQALFLIAQLVEAATLQRAQAERAAALLIDCLSIVRALEQPEDSSSSSTTTDDTFLTQMLKYIYSARISYIRSAELFNASDAAHLHYLHFLRVLTEHCNALPQFDALAQNYRLKIVKAVAISLQHIEANKAQSAQLSECIKLLQAFDLHAEHCTEILQLLGTQLKYNDYFTADTLQRTVYYELLVCVLQRLATLQQAVACDVFIRKFVKCYANFFKKLDNAELNVEQLEEAFCNFLQVSHHCIPQLDAKFFACMFVPTRKLTKSSVRLAALLLERDDKLADVFVAHLPTHYEQKELLYPLLSVALRKRITIDAALLQRVYQAYKNGFMKTIEKPQKAGVIYKEHVACSIALIEQCMPRSECLDFCNKNQFKFDVIEHYQMRIVHAIYAKARQSAEATAQQQCSIFVNFINVQIQMLSVDLKKQTLDLPKLELCAHQLYTWWQQTPEVAHDFAKILRSQQWLNFCKACLKLGMHVDAAHADLAALQQTDNMHGLLLQLLAYLCAQLYADYEHAEAVQYAEPAQLYEMICTHSKFHDILLNQHATQVKTQVLHLLYTLAKKCPTATLQQAQIPVILGAYQARLSDADRYALALLQLYEQHDCGLQQYRPFIWGESAIAFYALRADNAERANLLQQETSIAQVMSLIDRQLCDYTIDNFPIWRKLHAAQQLPCIAFADPTLKAQTFGANALEQRIERGCTQFDVAELRLCPKRASIYAQCYDPAFFIPLMNLCFAPEAYAHAARPVQNGLLALTFAALSSQDKDMRLAAGCAQQRYRAHFEASKFLERPLWTQAYDNIQAGLSDLRDTWMKHKKNSGTPRVPYIAALFVAKTFNLTTDPTHLLYKQLTMYLRLKSSFNFQCVPEFNVLFYSPEVEHHAFRQFIVEVIRNGIKSSSDLFLLVTTHTFKVLMGFYGSTMATLDMNLLILSVFSTCVKIPASTKIMFEHIGILPWLNSIISSVAFYHFDIIEGLISILSNLWYALRANAADTHNFTHLSLELHRLVVLLLPHLSARISLVNFARLLNVLQKTASDAAYTAVSDAQLTHLIACAQKHFPTFVHSIENVKRFGGCGAASQRDYCQQLHAQQLDAVAVLGLSSLRAYVIAWRERTQSSAVPCVLNVTVE